MRTLICWLKFNVVGAAGMLVQLTILAALNRLWPGRYLFTTAVAIEITLLHNFAWHMHYTWRSRSFASPWLHRLARFHLSSGLVSMAGNLGLMRILVHDAHLPILLANSIAILCCSAINFSTGNVWAFREDVPAASQAVETGLSKESTAKHQLHHSC